jgi:hypothetical protein
MKKYLFLLITITLIMVLSACSTKDQTSSNSKDTKETIVLTEKDKELKKKLDEGAGFELTEEQFLKVKQNQEKWEIEYLKTKERSENFKKKLEKIVNEYSKVISTSNFSWVFDEEYEIKESSYSYCDGSASYNLYLPKIDEEIYFTVFDKEIPDQLNKLETTIENPALGDYGNYFYASENYAIGFTRSFKEELEEYYVLEGFIYLFRTVVENSVSK